MFGKGIYKYKDNRLFKGIFKNNYPIKGIITYYNKNILDKNFTENNDKEKYDIYEGECNEKGCKKGEGIMKYKNGIIYEGHWDNDIENGKGLLCSNEYDYNLFKNNKILINSLCEMKKLNFKDTFYYGDFKNKIKDGKGISLLKNEELFSDNYKEGIFEGEFKNNKKIGKGKIYLNDNSIFFCYWSNNKIDKEREAKFLLYGLIEIKNNLNSNIWDYSIHNAKKKYYGDSRKKSLKKTKFR